MQETAGSTREQDIALPATTPADDAPATESPFGTPVAEQPPAIEVVEAVVPPVSESSFPWATGLLTFTLLVLLALAAFRIIRDRETLHSARRETLEARNEARRVRGELTRIETESQAARNDEPVNRQREAAATVAARRSSAMVTKLETRMSALLKVSHKLRDQRNDLQRANTRLRELVMSDPLTGLMNAARFTELLESELRRSLRVGKPLTLFICDVDGFRGFNEAHGTERGDLLLQRIAGHIEASFRRGGDTVARLGPDRYGVLAPETNYQAAVAYAETFRCDVDGRDFADDSSDVPELVTVSVGITEVNPDRAHEMREVLERTALTLQLAKRKGGNRVLGTRLRAVKGAAPRVEPEASEITDTRASEPESAAPVISDMQIKAADSK